MKHAREDYNPRIQDSSNKIPEDEPVFLLRGQDVYASEAVRFYAEMVRRNGGDPALVEKALNWSSVMSQWTPKKSPDLPNEADGILARLMSDEGVGFVSEEEPLSNAVKEDVRERIISSIVASCRSAIEKWFSECDYRSVDDPTTGVSECTSRGDCECSMYSEFFEHVLLPAIRKSGSSVS